MEVIGIAGDCEHNSSVSLFRDGVLVYAEAEERFSRVKGDGNFPKSALTEALSRSTGGPLTIAAAGRKKDGTICGSAHEPGSFHVQVADAAAQLDAPVDFVDHHRAHALTAAYFGPDGPASVFTADGQGDAVTATFSTWSPQTLEQHWANSVQAGSLGFFFAAITEYLGYNRLRDEGKVTALAAVGERIPELQRVFSELVWNDLAVLGAPRLRVNPQLVVKYEVGRPLYSPELSRRLRGFQPHDVAFAAQDRLEDVVVELLTALVIPHGALCLAGGLFGNVRLNYRIAERLSVVTRLCVAPPMGDEGLSIGAALDVIHRSGVTAPRPLSLALGRDAGTFPFDKVLGMFSGYTAIEARADDIIRAVAELLADGLPVARCCGRGEFGPRALGNRSLLYRPDDPSCRDWLNRSLGRDAVMPFAPCIREEDLSSVSSVDPARFSLSEMTIAVPATADFIKACPGVVHRDGTVRVQTVRDDTYPALWKLLMCYSARTGCPALLNTSLNRHGEPIVGTALDAMRCVADSGLPVLWVGDSQLIFSDSVKENVSRAFSTCRSAL